MKRTARIGKYLVLIYAVLLLNTPYYAQAIGTVELNTEVRSDSVVILEGIGDVNKGSTPSFGKYLENGYRFAIGAAGVIAVVQLVVAGIEYIYFGFSEGSVTKAKARATNALYGLMGILLTYVILQVINPGLVANGFNVLVKPLNEEIRALPTPPATTTSGGGDTGQGTANLSRSNNDATLLRENCPTCVDVKGIVPGLSFATNSRTNLSQATASKVELLSKNFGTNGWIVTEAFPPTRNGVTDINRHKHPCHKVGTCLDVQLTGSGTSGKAINEFALAASRAGFYPEYEVKSEAERKAIVSSGYEGCIKVIPGDHIGGPHFSLYTERQSSC